MGQINDGPDKPFKIGKNSRFHPDNQGAGKRMINNYRVQEPKTKWLSEDNYPEPPKGCIWVLLIILIILITWLG